MVVPVSVVQSLVTTLQPSVSVVVEERKLSWPGLGPGPGEDEEELEPLSREDEGGPRRWRRPERTVRVVMARRRRVKMPRRVKVAIMPPVQVVGACSRSRGVAAVNVNVGL